MWETLIEVAKGLSGLAIAYALGIVSGVALVLGYLILLSKARG